MIGARHSCPVPSDSTGSSSLLEKGQDDRGSVDTRSSGVDTMLQTQDKIMQNWSGGVDTRDSFQKTFWQMWDSVSTLAQVVSTLDQFSRKPSGSTGTVCRH
ncbi:hypothetical protein Taro_025440 [Colocasia esculenta]|uniref:Uncharacterized protein n=1 Tax=Colocasia esculenta TaxID=4460 RepID=A0A843VNC0_COLES|nr:hypothetical protein [Colocasia esculenta]